MKKPTKENIVYAVTVEEIQDQAEAWLMRELTSEEMDDVKEEICENNLHVTEIINDAISAVIKRNKLMNRNRNAHTKLVKYVVYWKNGNEWQKDYKKVFSALTEKDARVYIDMDSESPDDIYRLAKVEANTETEIEVIHLGHKNSLL